MSRPILALCTIVFFLACSSLASTNSILEAGINSFQQGKYDDAKQSFSNLMNDPQWRFAALYNLGNTAVRQNHLGEALGYYTRALHQNPHDRDTVENIKIVLSSLGGRRLAGAPSNFDILRNEVLVHFTFAESLVCVLVFSLFSLIGLRRFLISRRNETSIVPSPKFIAALVVLALFSTLSLLKLIDTYSGRGVIIMDHVDLRSGPSETNASMIAAPEGSEMIIHDTDHDWVQVNAIGGGTMGWIPKSSIMVTSGGGPF